MRFDTSKPDGATRKLLDVAKLDLIGSKAEIVLMDGIRTTYGLLNAMLCIRNRRYAILIYVTKKV